MVKAKINKHIKKEKGERNGNSGILGMSKKFAESSSSATKENSGSFCADEIRIVRILP
jgi:hypothetical protein